MVGDGKPTEAVSTDPGDFANFPELNPKTVEKL